MVVQAAREERHGLSGLKGGQNAQVVLDAALEDLREALGAALGLERVFPGQMCHVHRGVVGALVHLVGKRGELGVGPGQTLGTRDAALAGGAEGLDLLVAQAHVVHGARVVDGAYVELKDGAGRLGEQRARHEQSLGRADQHGGRGELGAVHAAQVVEHAAVKLTLNHGVHLVIRVGELAVVVAQLVFVSVHEGMGVAVEHVVGKQAGYKGAPQARLVLRQVREVGAQAVEGGGDAPAVHVRAHGAHGVAACAGHREEERVGALAAHEKQVVFLVGEAQLAPHTVQNFLAEEMMGDECRHGMLPSCDLVCTRLALMHKLCPLWVHVR